MILPSPIKLLAPRGLRTFLSLAVGNAVLIVINALLRGEGRRGVRLIKSGANFVWEIDDDYIRNLAGEPGSGLGSLNWKGVWAHDVEYNTGDIVIRGTATDQIASEAGTFVSRIDENIDNEPPAGDTQQNEQWARLAKGSWPRFVVSHHDDATLGSFDANGGRTMITLDNNSPATRIDLGRVGAIPAGMVGRTLTFKRIRACDEDTGEPAWFWFICAREDA